MPASPEPDRIQRSSIEPPPSKPKPAPAFSSRAMVNFWLDAALLMLLVALIWTSLVLRFVFPPGPLAKGWRLWGYTYDAWAELQFGILATLTLGVLLHVMLHWSWVCGILATRFSRNKGRIDEGLQTIYGVGLLIFLLTLLGVGVALASLNIQHLR